MIIPARNRTARRFAAFTAALTAATISLTATGGPASAATATGRDPALQRALNGVVAAGAPGAIAEVRDGHGVRRAVSGVADVRTGRAPDPRAHWRIASITKTFTATAVLQLAAAGRIGLDRPISAYLPGLFPHGDRITVRMLLQHTSGTYDYVADLVATPAQVRRTYRRTYRPGELIAMANAHKPSFPPGAKWAYDNTGYIALGMLLEKVTGRPADRVITDRIIGPLRLRHTTFPVTDPSMPRPYLSGYQENGHGGLDDLTVSNPSAGWTTGAMISTAADVNRFFAGLLRGRLLPAPMLAEMERTVRAEDASRGYGLGLRRMDLRCGRRVYGNIGTAFGYLTYAFADPVTGRRMTVVGNLTGPPDWLKIEPALGRVLTTAFCGAGLRPGAGHGVR